MSGCGLHGQGEGSGEREFGAAFFSLRAFRFRVMALPALSTGCSTDFVGKVLWLVTGAGFGLRELGVMSSFRGAFERMWVQVRVSWGYTLAFS